MDKLHANTWVVGIDIGGSHITAALVDLDNRVLVPNTLMRQKINAHASAHEIIGKWSAAIEAVFKHHPLGKTKVGIAIPGPFDYVNGISLMQNIDKYDALFGMNIKESLSENLPILPSDISMRNDAEAFLEGEVICGAAKGFKKAIGITLGTGLGSARYNNGVAEDARMGLNTPFLEGVAEDYLSTRWFVKRYYELTKKKVIGAKEVQEAMLHDPFAVHVFEAFYINLLAFLSIFIELDKPDVVIIGGNIANALQNDIPRLEKLLQRKYQNVVLRKAQFGEDAALIGSVFLSL